MFENMFQSHGVGSELSPGQNILAVGTVSIIPDEPGTLDESTLRQLSNQPPTADERLIATPNYLVYKTDYQVLAVMKKAFNYGANKYAGETSRKVIGYFLDQVDTSDQSIWMPWSEIYSAQSLVLSRTFSGMFGSREIPFYYCQVSHVAGEMTFLLNPVNHSSARDAAADFAGIFQSL